LVDTQQDPEAVALGAGCVVVPVLEVGVAWLGEPVVVVAVVLWKELVAGIQVWAWFRHFYPLVRTNLKSQELFQG